MGERVVQVIVGHFLRLSPPEAAESLASSSGRRMFDPASSLPLAIVESMEVDSTTCAKVRDGTN